LFKLRTPPRWDTVKVLKDKKILITAGPTWVPIDRIRVISNISSGRMGILLANEAYRRGMEVVLMLGPVGEVRVARGVNLLRFRFFDDFKKLLDRYLKLRYFDVIIHLAAVSDFRVSYVRKGKIPSDRSLKLTLRPTEKLANFIRKKAKKSFLVIFKFEAGVSKAELIRRAKAAMEKCSAQMVVANMFRGLRYIAFVIGGSRIYTVNSKEKLAGVLFRAIQEALADAD